MTEEALAAARAAGEILLPWCAAQAQSPIKALEDPHEPESTHRACRETLAALEPLRQAIHAQAEAIIEALPKHEDPGSHAFLAETFGLWILETTAAAWKIHECDAPELSLLTVYGAEEGGGDA